MKKQKKIFLGILLIFSILILYRLFASKKFSARGAFMGEASHAVTVKAMPVKREDLSRILSYVGSIKAKDEVNVFAKVTGKLAEYIVTEGDRVQKGQTIALIDRDETGLKYELAKVESPIAGIIGRTLLDKGANILTSTNILQGTPIAIIVNMDEMVVKLNAAEQDIPYLRKGLQAKVQVDAYAQDIFESEVSKVSEVVDPSTRTLPMEITIPNSDHRLKSGMFARIKIIASQHKNALVLPQDALIQEVGINYVFVVEDHAARKRGVSIGIREDNRIEILEGLKEGESVIVFGQQGLKDGTKVEAREE